MPEQHAKPTGVDPVLSVIAAAGLPGFHASSGDKHAGAATEDDPVMAIVRAAGLRGFVGIKVRSTDEGAPADPVLALIAAVGLPGFRTRSDAEMLKCGISANRALRGEAQVQEGGLPSAAVAQPTFANATRERSPHKQGGTASAPSNLGRQKSKVEYAILEIQPGGETALADLEAKMQMQFAASNCGKPYWSQAVSANGTVTRAFSVMRDQKREVASMIGPLGSTALCLKLEGVDRSQFGYAGDGAAGRNDNGPPQLPLQLPKALRAALGLKRS